MAWELSAVRSRIERSIARLEKHQVRKLGRDNKDRPASLIAAYFDLHPLDLEDINEAEEGSELDNYLEEGSPEGILEDWKEVHDILLYWDSVPLIERLAARAFLNEARLSHNQTIQGTQLLHRMQRQKPSADSRER